MPNYELTYTTDFAAAHNLREYHGETEPLHGHNWQVRVVICGPELDHEDMLVDFKEVETLVQDVLSAYRDRYINEIAPFDQLNPSSENLARIIFQRVATQLPAGRVRVDRVTVWETPACGITYSE